MDLRPRRYARRRAACLAVVYVLMAAHFAHWWFGRATLAPLEVSETMHTLELGVLTAGFLLMVVAVISTAIVGRFFCSWGCHILALEDLSAWMLGKIGIRPKPVRSRLLLLAPPVAALYMFVWPQVTRIVQGRSWPGWRIWSDSEGWASFVTENYWRSMPGLWVSVLTLFVCGFAVVYLLGSRSFCTYACPYGAVFAVADRFAPGRIVAGGDCSECGKCTAACQTHIRVHEELIQFGKIVNPSCLKAMDCVDACPKGSIVFGFRKPAFFESWRKWGRFGVPYDFTRAEDGLLLGVFVASLGIFRGLYDAIPFLLTLAIGGILGFVAVTAIRLGRAANVRLAPFQLKLHGSVTGAGKVFAVLAALLVVLTLHSGFVRYHEVAGNRSFDRAAAAVARGEVAPSGVLADAIAHLDAAERWGLVHPPDLDRRLASLHLFRDDPAGAEAYVRRVVEHDPEDAEWRIRLAGVLLIQERVEEAVANLRAVTERAPRQLRASAHEMLAEIRVAQGNDAEAAREYEAALLAWPESPGARVGLEALQNGVR